MTTGNCLVGTHTYDILANPYYLDDFQYISNDIEDRQKFIIDGDSDEDNDTAQCNLTRVILNLGYMPEKEAKMMKFDKNAFTSARKQHVRDVMKVLGMDFV